MPLTMKRKHRSRSASVHIIPIRQIGGDAGVDTIAMLEVILFLHSDGRSPNLYCLFTHPITGKRQSFSCRSADQDEAKIYASRHLAITLNRPLRESEAIGANQAGLPSFVLATDQSLGRGTTGV